MFRIDDSALSLSRARVLEHVKRPNLCRCGPGGALVWILGRRQLSAPRGNRCSVGFDRYLHHGRSDRLSRRTAVVVVVVLLAATWLACSVQLAAIDDRAKNDLLVRSVRLNSAYRSDVLAKINYIHNVLNFTAAYDSEHGIEETGRLIQKKALDRGLEGNIVIVNLSGKGIYANGKAMGPIDIGRRAHFQKTLQSATDALTLGSPIVSVVRSRAALPFAVPVRSHSGSIIGVVSTAVDSSAFTAAYDQRDLGNHGVLDLIDTDSHVFLSRYAVAGETGRPPRLSASFIRRIFAASGNYWQRSTIDGFERAFSFSHIPHYPIAAAASSASRSREK